MVEPKKNLKELRSGAIVAIVTACLFVLLLGSFAVPGTGKRDLSEGDFETMFPPVYYGAPFAPANGDGAQAIPVLCHHFLRDNTSPFEVVKILGALFLNLPLLDNMDVWTQTASAFEKQIVYLKKQGYTAVDMDDLVAWRAGLIRLPEKSVVITFDDGARSVMDLAYPILKKHGMKATLFIVTSQVGKKWEGIDVLTWQELRLLQRSGVFSIESHSHGLHRIVRSSQGYLPLSRAMSEAAYPPQGGVSWREAVLDDLTESRRLIAEHLDHDARHLAWPYGAHSAELDSLALLAGFRSMGTLQRGANTRLPGEDAGIKRYLITARTSARNFSTMFPR
jgi:peptidoglycan/xylan/chitin deacetylase (PgdA/CDA1 family)